MNGTKFINRDKILEAKIYSPVEEDITNPFTYAHGWQVSILFGFDGHGNNIYRDYDFVSEKACLAFIESLKLVEIPVVKQSEPDFT